MGGGGFMQHANDSLKGNRAMQKGRTNLREAYRSGNQSAERGESDLKTLDKREEIRRENRERDKRLKRLTSILFFTMVVVIAAYLLIIILFE